MIEVNTEEILLIDNMSIFNDLLVEIVMEDLVNVNSTGVIQTPFNISFDIKSMANFYAIYSSFLLACYYFQEYKNLTIKNNTNQLSNNLALGQKSEITRYIRSKEPH